MENEMERSEETVTNQLDSMLEENFSLKHEAFQDITEASMGSCCGNEGFSQLSCEI